MKITQAKIRKLFDYRADGTLIRRINGGKRTFAGDIAGTANPDGRLRIQIDRKVYLNHRLIWLWHHGYLPEHALDHIDRNPGNNRIENLREVSLSCNQRNTDNRADNISGVKGVCWSKSRQKWHVQIGVSRKVINLGYYTNFLEAVCHRLAAEQYLDWEGCDSSSPAYQYVKKHITG